MMHGTTNIKFLFGYLPTPAQTVKLCDLEWRDECVDDKLHRMTVVRVAINSWRNAKSYPSGSHRYHVESITHHPLDE